MGNVVLSKLDEVSLEKIAAIGNGKYYRGTNTQDELDQVYEDLNALEKKEFGSKQFTDYEDRFQFFLAAGIILLIAELLISERRSKLLARWSVLQKQEVEG
jgi:Ca-activated chloride channel family protein